MTARILCFWMISLLLMPDVLAGGKDEDEAPAPYRGEVDTAHTFNVTWSWKYEEMMTVERSQQKVGPYGLEMQMHWVQRVVKEKKGKQDCEVDITITRAEFKSPDSNANLPAMKKPIKAKLTFSTHGVSKASKFGGIGKALSQLKVHSKDKNRLKECAKFWDDKGAVLALRLFYASISQGKKTPKLTMPWVDKGVNGALQQKLKTSQKESGDGWSVKWDAQETTGRTANKTDFFLSASSTLKEGLLNNAAGRITVTSQTSIDTPGSKSKQRHMRRTAFIWSMQHQKSEKLESE